MRRAVGSGAALATIGLAFLPAGAPAAPQSLDVVGASLRQHGPRLALKVRTAEDWRPSDLRRNSLCLELHRARTTGRVCVWGARRLKLRFDSLRPDGTVRSFRRLRRAKVRRGDRRSFLASFSLASVDLHPGKVRWRVFSSPRAGCSDPVGSVACQVSTPRAGLARLRIRRPRRVGCTRRGRALHSRGSRRHRSVALTFDDGPSRYSRAVLRILRRFHVPATFYLVGTEVRRHPRLARRELRAGHELGNHSLRHSLLPSYRDLRGTSRVIRRVTGFKPCTFRPPGGALGRGLVRSALSLRMTTVLWSVDPRDWSRPGAGTIARRILGGVRPGAILLLHDGGGPRSQTVAALPTILRGLRRRGYRFQTVSRLLGGHARWYPR